MLFHRDLNIFKFVQLYKVASVKFEVKNKILEIAII